MTYALPWRYSTTELKGPFLFNSGIIHYVDKISICTYIINISIYALNTCSRYIVSSGSWIYLGSLGENAMNCFKTDSNCFFSFIELIPPEQNSLD